jgi:hypothetical protein
MVYNKHGTILINYIDMFLADERFSGENNAPELDSGGVRRYIILISGL